jgi:glycosyltransferase involved in cell wall biosynthesis
MSATPFISVILSTRDRPALLADCLADLRVNDYAQREIIVVDQSRGDETAAVVQRAASLDPSLRYVRTDTTGLSRAQKVALASARGEVVAFTNDDCRPAADWLACLAAEFAPAPEVVAVFGPFLPLTPSPGTLAVATLTTRRRRVQRGPREEVWRLGYGGNMAFRRQAVIDAGGPDEMLGPGSPRNWGCNDIDLIYRVLRVGGLAVYAPDVVVWHVQQFGLRQALQREAVYARGAGALIAKLLRCGDKNAYHLLMQRVWPLGPGRNWRGLLESIAGGHWWAVVVRALFRTYCVVFLIPSGIIAGWRQPLQNVEHMLYQGSAA